MPAYADGKMETAEDPELSDDPIVASARALRANYEKESGARSDAPRKHGQEADSRIQAVIHEEWKNAIAAAVQLMPAAGQHKDTHVPA
jgi:hypothetical protein